MTRRGPITEATICALSAIWLFDPMSVWLPILHVLSDGSRVSEREGGEEGSPRVFTWRVRRSRPLRYTCSHEDVRMHARLDDCRLERVGMSIWIECLC